MQKSAKPTIPNTQIHLINPLGSVSTKHQQISKTSLGSARPNLYNTQRPKTKKDIGSSAGAGTNHPYKLTTHAVPVKKPATKIEKSKSKSKSREQQPVRL